MPRNVLFIVVDQWRADCLPLLGARHLKTPNLDRLCREGVTFRNHVTTAVPCGPARASLATARIRPRTPLAAALLAAPALLLALFDPVGQGADVEERR